MAERLFLLVAALVMISAALGLTSSTVPIWDRAREFADMWNPWTTGKLRSRTGWTIRPARATASAPPDIHCNHGAAPLNFEAHPLIDVAAPFVAPVPNRRRRWRLRDSMSFPRTTSSPMRPTSA